MHVAFNGLMRARAHTQYFSSLMNWVAPGLDGSAATAAIRDSFGLLKVETVPCLLRFRFRLSHNHYEVYAMSIWCWKRRTKKREEEWIVREG